MTKFVLRLALSIGALSLLLVIGMRQLNSQPGDPARGADLYDGGRLACTACHDASSAPPLRGIASRIAQLRLPAVDDANENVTLYLAESIIDPDRYVVPGYPAHNMPRYTVGFTLNWQDLSDLVAYLMTL